MKICLAILILFHIIYFFPFYFTENVFFQEDLIFLTIPLKYEAARIWRMGQIPFWDNKISNGVPLLANPTSSAIYPLLLPFILFLNLKTYTYLSLFHHLFFLIGIFYFSNLILKNPFFSIFFSNFLGYNGIILRFFVFTNPLWGIAYLPWSLFFFYKYLNSGKKIHLILTAILFSLSILAGFDLAPFLFSFSILLLTFFVNVKKLFNAFFCIFLAFLLSAPLTIPAIKYIPFSQRGIPSDYESSTGFFSLNPLRVFEILIPNFHGIQGSALGAITWNDALLDNETYFFTNIYFGMLNILFLFSVRPIKRQFFLFIFTVFFLVLSFGKYFPLHYYISKIPILSLIRYPEKYLLFILIFFYIFFTFNLKEIKKISLIPSITLISGIFILLTINKITGDNLFNRYISFTSFSPPIFASKLMTNYLLIALILSTITLILFIFFFKRKSIIYIFLIFSFIDLYYGTNKILVPTSPKALYSPVVKSIKSTGNGRIYSLISSENVKFYFPSDLNQDYCVKLLSPIVGVFHGIDYSFLELIDKMNPAINFKIKKEDLDLFGVSHIILLGKKIMKGKKVCYFSNEFSVNCYNENPTILWLLSKDKTIKKPLPMPKIKNPSRIRISLNNNEDAILFLGITNLPGWKIYVNKKEKCQADKNLKGLNVYLERGKNIVEFIYKPPGLFRGIFLFLLGIIIISFYLKLR